jgi:hypothetical protein
MKKTTIYTFSHNRPDLINLQYNSIKKHLKDDFDFIIFNNEKPGSEGGFEKDRISQITAECKKLRITCIPVEFDLDLQVLNNEIMFHNNQYVNGTTACAYSLSWAWKHIISKDPGISVVLDSDMFLCRDVSFIKMMEGYNFAHCPSYRNNFSFMYPWNGIVIANTQNLPNASNMTWGNGIVNGTATDVGGELYYYRERHKSELKELYIDMWSILEDTQKFEQVSINGSALYFVDFNNKELFSNEPQARLPLNKKTFPHQTERQNYSNYFYANYEKIKKLINSYNFPKPSYIDLIKLENADDMNESFIFHYKSASNYQQWATQDYNINKTKSLKTFLDNT